MIAPGREPERRRHPQRRPLAQRAEALVFRLEADVGAAGQHLGDAAQKQHEAQRHHERRDAQARDDSALEQADNQRDPERDGHRGADAEAAVHREVAGGDAGDADDRSDRQVDAARDDHHRLAQGEQRDQRDVPDVVLQVVPAEEQRVQHRGDDRQRDHHPQHRQLFLERSHAGSAISDYFFISLSSAQKAARLLLSIFWIVVSMKVGMVLPSRTSFSAFID